MSILSVQDVSKSYKLRQVVKSLSIEIKSGEVVGLLGPNGAGKTTAFYMIVGLIATPVAQADSIYSECHFSNSPGERPGEKLTTPGQCELSYGAISFDIQASANSSINQLRIQPAGLTVDNSELSAELARLLPAAY